MRTHCRAWPALLSMNKHCVCALVLSHIKALHKRSNSAFFLSVWVRAKCFLPSQQDVPVSGPCNLYLPSLLPRSPHCTQFPALYPKAHGENIFSVLFWPQNTSVKSTNQANPNFLIPILCFSWTSVVTLIWLVNSLRQGISFSNNQATRAIGSHPGKLILRWEVISLPFCCPTSLLLCKSTWHSLLLSCVSLEPCKQILEESYKIILHNSHGAVHSCPRVLIAS